jgi:hypothetical protein
MNKDEASAMDLALEALEESVDLVREDYENAKRLYSNYPSRQARLIGLEDGLSKHEAAITAIKQARSAPEQELSNLQRHEQNVQKFLGAQPAPVQEPVAWLTEERYAQLHTAQRQWVELTDEERDDISEDWATDVLLDIFEVIRAIEAKLKEKNT